MPPIGSRLRPEAMGQSDGDDAVITIQLYYWEIALTFGFGIGFLWFKWRYIYHRDRTNQDK